MGTYVPMTAQGGAHSRLRRALDHGASALVVRALALEAGRLELHDGLAVCLVLLDGEPERYGAWAARWASRFVHEAAGADLDEAALVLARADCLTERNRLASTTAKRSRPTPLGEPSSTRPTPPRPSGSSAARPRSTSPTTRRLLTRFEHRLSH